MKSVKIFLSKYLMIVVLESVAHEVEFESNGEIPRTVNFFKEFRNVSNEEVSPKDNAKTNVNLDVKTGLF